MVDGNFTVRHDTTAGHHLFDPEDSTRNRRLKPSVAQVVESSAAERTSAAAVEAERSLQAKAQHCPSATTSSEAPNHEVQRVEKLQVVNNG